MQQVLSQMLIWTLCIVTMQHATAFQKQLLNFVRQIKQPYTHTHTHTRSENINEYRRTTNSENS